MSDNSHKGPIVALYDFFRSLKLAVVLILILTALSVVATLIPQGREQAFYFTEYPVFGTVFIGLGFNSMFTSFLFLLPTALFFANLSVCATHRFVTRWRTKARKRFGPDILHAGLLLLMVGALFTFLGRTEETIFLRTGQSAEIPGGYVMTLDDFVFEQYEDGSPKEWLSTTTVTKEGEVVKDRAVIEVNSPLKLGNLKFYQYNYGREEGIVLADLEGNRFWLSTDDLIPTGSTSALVVRGIGPAPFGGDNVVLFDIWEDHEIVGQRSELAGTVVGEWMIEEVVFDYYTGLQMVRDPGYYTVLVALILITIGIFLTYIQKMTDNQV